MMGSALRAHRLECGLTQGELATRAGVSRQLVAAAEAGRNTPAVDAALRLATTLATTVEELFAPAGRGVVSALGDRLRDDVPLRVGRVGEELVATELPDHGVSGANWATPDGILRAGTLQLFSGAPSGGIVVAGCDPALGVAEAMLAGLGRRSLIAISTTTAGAVHALERGRVHAALVHGPATALPKAPVPVVRWQFAHWQVGLATAPAVKGDTLDALLGGDTPIVEREPGAASQHAFDRVCVEAGISDRRPGPRATGHIDAARIAARINGAAVTTEAAARAFDLRFLALEDHTVEIWLAERWLDAPGADALADLVASGAFVQRVATLAGYDLTGCGTRL
jgi:DNA-binding XRE family transcriptional regulator